MKNKIITVLSIIIIIQSFFLIKLLKTGIKPKPLKQEASQAQKQTRPAEETPDETPPEKARDQEKRIKIAIIIDDWGYNIKNLDILQTMRYPITLSILPNLAYSRRIDQEAHDLGFETMLHLPLEPHKSKNMALEKNTIMTTMTDKEIISILKNALENIPHAKGVSNHQGSKATGDQRVIKTIFKILKEKDLFFVDSLTSKSVCAKVASEFNMKFAARSVFLDNQLNEKYIENQMWILVKKAKSSGNAIGIGHDRRPTLEVLSRIMPSIAENEGVEFVFASELTR
ncbi:MAG: hypothetical protein COV72_00300 [Candidatus Omnitrophica bacterium CG11_big_fil_rev_8_21_14_0_20_42_13]|uniref:Divergent polysaccharide deacetylase family protein n=1 Tax=Candidatus Ghiorseimicrobium undicola TaxID=1974746 RepID=A0A2H0M021_9BACT|nr:MAG: hypothetical protein COV72_00300 [Candidatus Omnitrophica bacterium CG11_big_fil_rev_8_21_14_0_20_42_13]